ncbi:ankyrin repeat-containing domain protein [Truncatella angustata]|uniref:Ankyrin repeat-containing domain protein n=1 Tax=Truncatella angustata TaxID=152316 RepID=A0A9P8ZVG9_9PEZI|nr:ankyrin repeat-containing domain protein [Truncatella angustata]KAH6651946.1 ankyrin repeat-containing domain protein [Truncatella angustata]KAH8205672.1 hypothetical protein TruAng_000166 [Truncatella angustata]
MAEGRLYTKVPSVPHTTAYSEDEKCQVLDLAYCGKAAKMIGLIKTIADRESLTAGHIAAITKDHDGASIGHYAARGNSVESRAALGRALMEFTVGEASVKTAVTLDKDKNGNSPILEACYVGHTAIIDILHKNGGSLTSVNLNQDTAAHRAVLGGSITALNKLIQLKAPLGKQNKNGATPLHLAVNEEDLDLVDALLATGLAQMEVKNKQGMTALDIAEEKELGEIEALLRHYQF